MSKDCYQCQHPDSKGIHTCGLDKNIIDQMRDFAMSLSDDIKCPMEYAKFNRIERRTEFDNPGGRAWLMYFLDLFEKEKYGK